MSVVKLHPSKTLEQDRSVEPVTPLGPGDAARPPWTPALACSSRARVLVSVLWVFACRSKAWPCLFAMPASRQRSSRGDPVRRAERRYRARRLGQRAAISNVPFTKPPDAQVRALPARRRDRRTPRAYREGHPPPGRSTGPSGSRPDLCKSRSRIHPGGIASTSPPPHRH